MDTHAKGEHDFIVTVTVPRETWHSYAGRMPHWLAIWNIRRRAGRLLSPRQPSGSIMERIWLHQPVLQTVVSPDGDLMFVFFNELRMYKEQLEQVLGYIFKT